MRAKMVDGACLHPDDNVRRFASALSIFKVDQAHEHRRSPIFFGEVAFDPQHGLVNRDALPPGRLFACLVNAETIGHRPPTLIAIPLRLVVPKGW